MRQRLTVNDAGGRAAEADELVHERLKVLHGGCGQLQGVAVVAGGTQALQDFSSLGEQAPQRLVAVCPGTSTVRERARHPSTPPFVSRRHPLPKAGPTPTPRLSLIDRAYATVRSHPGRYWGREEPAHAVGAENMGSFYVLADERGRPGGDVRSRRPRALWLAPGNTTDPGRHTTSTDNWSQRTKPGGKLMSRRPHPLSSRYPFRL